MPTILEVINKTTPYFEKQGVDSPRLTIELLLAHALKKKRLQLYLEFERALDEPTLARLREMVRRRADGEPIQYILGEAEFHGLKFAVDRRVLIPRPETELLVETVVRRLQTADHRPQTADTERSDLQVVDVGTGSGCIAITLAKKLTAVQVTAIDSSADALAVARANAATHGVENNVRFLEGNLLSVLVDSASVDGIVSNPPYIASGEIAKLPREVKDFEPVQALVAGEDGLEVIRRLVRDAGRFLSPTGWIALELGAGQRPSVERLLAEQGLATVEVVKDLQGHERVIVAVPGPKPK